VNALPSIGGAVGGLLGGIGGTAFGVGIGGVPGAVGGAALGGGAGEAAKQLINRARGAEAPDTATDAAANIGGAGAVQGGLEAAGGLLVAPAAKGLYGLALRPIKGLRDKYGLKNLVDAGFENSVMPTKGGADKALGLMKRSKATQQGMAQSYDAAGKPQLSVMKAVNEGLAPMAKDALAAQQATGAGGAAASKIARQAASVLKDNGPSMPAAGMAAAKHSADDLADPAFAAARRTGGVVDPGSKAGIAKGWSKGYRTTLNDALGPEYAKQGLKTKTLYGLSRAADYSAERPEMASNIMSLVGGAASSGGDPVEGLKDALTYRILLSPRMQAGAALSAKPLARYGTRAADIALGSPLEQLLRQALIAQLAQEQGQ
jgi:hypothetical protein